MWRAEFRWWQALHFAPWIAADFTFAADRRGWSLMTVSPLTPDAPPRDLIVKATWRGVEPLPQLPPGPVWVAGDGAHPAGLTTSPDQAAGSLAA